MCHVYNKPTFSFKSFADDILDLILAYYFLSNTPTTAGLCIRLVNKRFSLLSLPHILHTISVDNISALVKLVSAPYSPLYHRPFSIHVRCFELAFLPYHYKLVFSSPINPVDGSLDTPDATDHRALDPFICENLQVVRFKFKLGTPLDKHPRNEETMKKFNARLYQESARRQASIVSNVSWFCFLSKFSPRRFEWTLPSEAEVSTTMYFLGLYSELSTLLRLWNIRGLCAIYLSGICLVKQASVDAPWCISLLAEYVQVAGPWLYGAPFIVANMGAVSQDRICKKLVLEERSRLKVPSTIIKTERILRPTHGFELLLQDWYFEDTAQTERTSSSPSISESRPEEVAQQERQEHQPEAAEVPFMETDSYKVFMLLVASLLFFLTLCLFGWLTIRAMIGLLRFSFWLTWSLLMGPLRLATHIGEVVIHYTSTVIWAALRITDMANLVPRSTPPTAFVSNHPITVPPPTSTIPSRLYISQSIKYASKMCPGTHQSKAM